MLYSKGNPIDQQARSRIVQGEVYLSVMTTTLIERFRELNPESALKDTDPLIVEDPDYGNFRCSHIFGFGNSGTVLSVDPYKIFGIFTCVDYEKNQNKGISIPQSTIDALDKDFFKL